MLAVMDLEKFFIEEIWSINPIGSKNTGMKEALSEFRYTLSTKRDISGQKLEPEVIRDKYKAYYDLINKVNLNREDRFKSTALSIYEWLSLNKFTEDLSKAPKDPLDLYLYGE